MNRTRLVVAALLASALSAAGARAEDPASYPARTVKIVVSTPAGSQQDSLGRMLADSLRAQFKQPFIIQNVPGAGSVASAAFVARAPADGYTILIANAAPIGIAKALRSDLTYDPAKDLLPVGQLTASYFMVVVNPETIAAKTIPDLVSLLKASPGKYNFASSGIGGMVDMETELFMLRTGTRITQVPYKSSGEVTNALVSGYVDLSVDTTDALPEVKAGQLRALAVTAPRRFPELPQVPTLQELIPGYGVGSVWQGVFVPAATPPAIVARLNRAIAAFLKAPATLAQMKNMELTPVASSPQQFAALVKADAAIWAEVIKANGIKTQ